jgi:hypothetical protein
VLVFGRVGRWYIFKPKIPIWVNFVGSEIEDVGILYIWPFGLLLGHIHTFIYFPVLVYFSCFGMLYQEKSVNLAFRCTSLPPIVSVVLEEN